MEEKQKSYDIFGQTGLDEGLLLNFGTERLEFEKKFSTSKARRRSLLLRYFVNSVHSVEK